MLTRNRRRVYNRGFEIVARTPSRLGETGIFQSKR